MIKIILYKYNFFYKYLNVIVILSRFLFTFLKKAQIILIEKKLIEK